MQFPNKFYIREIEETLDKATDRTHDVLNSSSNDRYKVTRLLEIIGELEGALVFLRNELSRPEKKPWWKIWK